MDELPAGHRIASRFEIVRPAASGSFGAIYLAIDRADDSQVALKVLLRSSDGPRFTREARVLADIHDEGVVPYVAHGIDGNTPYLAMRWLDGEDLDHRLARGPLSVDETLALGRRIARGLGAAHARGVVHRDVKPTNIFLVQGDAAQAVLLDFGIARARSELTQTARGMVIGTPGYLAPEQARAESEVDARADIFALGSVLWECVAGRPAFDGPTVMTILTKVLFDPVPPLHEVMPGVPHAFSALLMRTMAKEPDARPVDGAALARELLTLSTPPASSREREEQAPLLRTGIGDAERTLVTVLVARDLDPPRGGMATWTALAAQWALRLEALADGTVAALLRGEAVATDQAANAARLGLSLLAARPSLAVGMATGRSVLSQGAEGDIIARAAALVGAAPGVLVDATTAGLLGDRFRMRLEAKGAELLEEDRSGRTRRVVGREHELALAEALFGRVLVEETAQSLLLGSDPGLGKTALAREIVAHIAASEAVPSVWQVAGERLTQDEPWAVMGRLLRGAGAPEETDPARAAVVFERWASARLGEGDPGVELALTMAGLMQRASSPFVRAARESQGVYAVHAHETLVRLVRAEAERSPLLIVVEDLHHADPSSYEALAELTSIEAPTRALFVITARLSDPGAARLDRLGRGARSARLTLGKLSPKAAEELVREGLDASSRDLESRVQDICMRADGSPFLLNELVRADRAGVRGLPGTVSAVLQGRFDGLPGNARRVLRAASVLGAGAPDDLLAVTGPLDIDAALNVLLNDGILGREPGSMAVSFRNPLLHEVAYGMLTEGDRILAHQLVAQRLEESGRGSAALLAEHWLRAKQPARAAAWLNQLARDALATDDVSSATRFAERGLTAATGALRGDLLATLAEAKLWGNDLTAAAEAAREALRLLPRGARAWCRAVGASGVAEGRLGNVDALEALAMDLVLVGGDVDPQGPSALATALARVSNHLFFLNRLDAGNAVVTHLEGIAKTEGAGDPLVEMRVAQALGIATRFRGNLREHVEWSERALERAQALGDRRTSALLLTNLGDALRTVGRAAEAEVLLRSGLTAARSMGLSALEVPLRLNLGAALSELGRDDEACSELAIVVRDVLADGDARVVIDARLTYARALARAGRSSEAMQHVDAASEGLAEDSPYRPLAIALGVSLSLGDRKRKPADTLRDAELAAQLLEAQPPDAAESFVWLTLAAAQRSAGDESGADQAISVGWGRVLTSLDTLGDLASDALANVPDLAQLYGQAVIIGVAVAPEPDTRDTLPP
jgi:tetratricopeptide (TPR) repeat protein